MDENMSFNQNQEEMIGNGLDMQSMQYNDQDQDGIYISNQSF